MMMDLQTALVCVGFVVISAAILLFISMVVTKEKSYEEAIAEQRQQTSALLGTQHKSKLKDKKQKKAGKKVKEKLQLMQNEADAAEDSENADIPPTEAPEIAPAPSDPQPKHHVEFKEPEILDEPVKEVTKRRSKKDKVRPILLNREMSEEKIVQVDEVPPANHFEQLHPKDEFELMHSHIQKDEALKQESSAKEKPAKQKQNADGNESKSSKKAVKHQTNEIIAQISVEKEVKEVPVVEQETTVVATQTNGFVSAANNGGKEKKKKKSEHNTIQQLAGDKQEVNHQILSTLVRKAELSHSEVQALIDMLLNKQHEAPAVIDDWSEGKADPVQKLKKQLAEKEKLLAEEQAALASAQAKLKEVRVEQATERSQLQQKARGLEEVLNGKEQELQAANQRIHGINQQIQALQAQVNEEIRKNRKLSEDNNAVELHRQQYETRLSEADELKEMMQNDLRSLTEQLEKQKSVIAHLQYELTQKDEVSKQFEEAKIEMEHRVNLQMRQDNDNKTEIRRLETACQQHLEEIRRLELNKNQFLSDLKTQRDQYEKAISQLNHELERVKDEKQTIEACRENEVEEEKKSQVKIKNLQNEISSQFATVDKLQNELDQQKNKNNMEIAAAKQQEQLLQKNLLQRLFPKLDIHSSLPHDKWISQIENSIKNYITDLERPKTPEPVDNSELVKLQVQIQKNKQSLDEYDRVLIKLQKSAAETEMQWGIEIKNKNSIIAENDKIIKQKDDTISSIEQKLESFKEEIQQLRLQLSAIETELLTEKEVNERLTSENVLISRPEKNTHNDATAQIERLQEDTNRMSEQLLEEQKINNELRIQIEAIKNLSNKTINHNNTSNGPSVTVENNGNQ